MNTICIIPARLQSTRLPGKLLMTLGEYSIIEHVYRNCVEANVFTKVLIAVDDDHMLEHCATFCDDIIMTKMTINPELTESMRHINNQV